MEWIPCKHCSTKHRKTALKKSCGNCFACTYCEIYLCPKCGKRIVVTPMREPGQNRDAEDKG
jgi:hypothetical protein